MPRQVIFQAGAIRSLEDVKKVVTDLQRWVDSISALLQPTLVSTSPVTPQVLVLESDGMIHPWEIVAGSGASVNYDPGTRTIEITSP